MAAEPSLPSTSMLIGACTAAQQPERGLLHSSAGIETEEEDAATEEEEDDAAAAHREDVQPMCHHLRVAHGPRGRLGEVMRPPCERGEVQGRSMSPTGCKHLDT